jgi:hypothetical protein
VVAKLTKIKRESLGAKAMKDAAQGKAKKKIDEMSFQNETLQNPYFEPKPTQAQS